MNTPDNKKAGFTLIELLAAIAILGVLSAILISVIRSVRERAENVQCVSNLRQIGVGFSLYLAENGQEIPYGLPGGNVTWIQTLSPYLGGKQYPANWVTPSEYLDVRPTGVWACPSSDAVTKSGSYADYGKNEVINPSPTAEVHYRIWDLDNPSKVIAAGDSTGDNGVGEFCGRGLGPWNSHNNSGLMARHSGRANVLYYDFHVGSIDPKTMPPNGYVTQNSPPWK